MSKCGICGEPMPPGEEMFKYHGYSGDCPKPPLPKATPPAATDALVAELRESGNAALNYWCGKDALARAESKYPDVLIARLQLRAADRIESLQKELATLKKMR